VLSLERVSKSYWRGTRQIVALDAVSLELGRGDFFAVHGANRAGKTTLLRIAAGIDVPDSGRVCYRGRDLAEMSDRERAHYMRNEVGCAWARWPYSGNLSVLDYTAIPLFADRWGRRRARQRAYQVLERVGAEQCLDAHLIELSDGERQRVELARALVRGPKILLADEPVSASDLNIVQGDQMLALLQSVAREARIAVMITSSSASGAMRARRIMGLDRGRLITTRPVEPGQVVQFPKRPQAQQRKA
jgi:putative ABC transport system ATP-binding protein